MDYKIFCVGYPSDHLNWTQGLRVDTMSVADLVFFTGGTDISSSIYGKRANRANQRPDTARDEREIAAFEMARAMQLPMFGTCRGAQLLCALAGGILVQDQDHPSSHYIHTVDGRQLKTTSCHHQRAYPYGVNHKLIAWADNLCSFNLGEDDEDMTGEKEAEIVYYPEIKALGVQGHLEWCYPARTKEDLEFVTYSRMLVKMLIAGNL